jgi:beta-galactosidase
MFRLPLNDLKGVRWSNGKVAAPAFHRAEFRLTEPGDTWLDMRGWGKGSVWINGRNLGRYWKIGPQQTLFCPGVWLRRGANEIVVLDLHEAATRSVAGLNGPVWETL